MYFVSTKTFFCGHHCFWGFCSSWFGFSIQGEAVPPKARQEQCPCVTIVLSLFLIGVKTSAKDIVRAERPFLPLALLLVSSLQDSAEKLQLQKLRESENFVKSELEANKAQLFEVDLNAARSADAVVLMTWTRLRPSCWCSQFGYICRAWDGVACQQNRQKGPPRYTVWNFWTALPDFYGFEENSCMLDRRCRLVEQFPEQKHRTPPCCFIRFVSRGSLRSYWIVRTLNQQIQGNCARNVSISHQGIEITWFSRPCQKDVASHLGRVIMVFPPWQSEKISTKNCK